MHPIKVNNNTFDQEVLQSNTLVIADFWAPWCAPCRVIAPLLEEIATEYAGRVKVVKINTDEEQELAMRYSIRSIPTLKIFRNGTEMDELIGAVPKQMLTNKIDYYMQGATVLN